jgi:hypothetical protein
MNEGLPTDATVHGEAPDPSIFFVPRLHVKALDFDAALVVGARGVGKSAWFNALLSAQHREKVIGVLQSLGVRSLLKRNTLVSPGFGTAPRPDDYPEKDTLTAVGRDAQGHLSSVWKAILFSHVVKSLNGSVHHRHVPPQASWSATVKWVRQNTEEVARAFAQYEAQLKKMGAHHLFVFDALDRAADGWENLDKLLKALLQVMLEFRSYSFMRCKAFVRPDMIQSSAVTAFPDASKLLMGQAELTWDTADLFGLLFQSLANAPDGDWFCSAAETAAGPRTASIWLRQSQAVVPSPALCARDGLQRDLFHAICGPWMGTNHRRGFPYSWLPKHLADSRGRASPRSFLSAIRGAADDSALHKTEHRYALHYESIKLGVQNASRIRVTEIAEDYPWVDSAVTPLKGLVVPCSEEDVLAAWTPSAIKGVEDAARRGLRPRRLSLGSKGLLLDLKDMGLLTTIPDGRLNMPDVYRVGFKLGRMGGVKPIQ